MATIEKTRVAEKGGMAGFFAKKRGEEVSYVDAWNVSGEIDGRPYDIQTTDHDRALAYAHMIDEGDEAGIDAALN